MGKTGCAVWKCVPSSDDSMHQFPDYNKSLERFQLWLEAADNFYIEKYMTYAEIRERVRICGKHFAPEDKCSGGQLQKTAVPKLFLPAKKNDLAESTFQDNAKFSSSSDDPEPSTSVSSERTKVSDKMLEDLFQECRPISRLEDIEPLIVNPPTWIRKIIELKPRSGSVFLNNLSDCHSLSERFFPRPRFDAKLLPKTLVCHDYAGGYLDDRFLLSEDSQKPGKGYPFYNWSQIDIFVYFSHHLITIPPLCWINLAHKNGVKILGTFITEFKEGIEICKEIFATLQTTQNFVTNLVAITSLFNLDGWLLNIENKIEGKILQNLKYFVALFTKKLHEYNAECMVIWYDSVTITGELAWQNELNTLNKFYFDHCDGIFLNYVWTEQLLIKSAELAKHRQMDVFVGIDVFGRNTFGGGQFNCYKAAELIRRHNLSMAIFAPGWTHETIPKKDANFFKIFLEKDNAFWSTLLPYLYTHPINDFFVTKFYIGLDNKHYNLFNQQQQLTHILHPKNPSIVPNHETIPSLKNKCNCMQVGTTSHNDVVKNVCILTNQFLKRNTHFLHHLFVCDLLLKDNCVVFFGTKFDTGFSVDLLVCGQSGSFSIVKLLSTKRNNTVNNLTLLEVNPSEDKDLIKDFVDSYKLEEDLKLRFYELNIRGRVLEIGGHIEKDDHRIELHCFGITNKLVFNEDH